MDAQQLNINLAFSHYQRDIIMMNGTPRGETSGRKKQRQPELASSIKIVINVKEESLEEEKKPQNLFWTR